MPLILYVPVVAQPPSGAAVIRSLVPGEAGPIHAMPFTASQMSFTQVS